MSTKVVPMIHVPDVRTTVKAAAYERLEGLVDVIAPMNDTFYGNREFIIRDPNGFWLTFGQPLRVMEP